MSDIEIGRAKRARRAFSFDDIAVVPSRRTRDPEAVSTTWSIDALKFEIPVLAAPMDSVVSPRTAITIGKLGGIGVLNLEGLWTRYDNPEAVIEVRAAPTGTIIGRRLVKPSGSKEWDEAVLRAIDRTGSLPKDTDGRVPGTVEIVFRPKD